MFHAIALTRVSPTISTAYTLAPPANAQAVRIQCKTAALTYTLDGTTPTAGVGFNLAVGDFVDLPITPAPKLYSATGAAEVVFLQ